MGRRLYIAVAIVVGLVVVTASYVTISRTNPTIPGPPTQLQAIPGDGQVALTWIAPSSDGGSPINGYLTYVVGTNMIVGVIGTKTSCTVFPLENGRNYSFFVRAQNSIGLGPSSNVVSVTLPGETPFPIPPSANTIVSFIDVGQGDSILIETPDSKHILIDAGPESADTTVISYLQQRSVTVLDALIATHPDADHIGGADEVLGTFQVLKVYHSGLARDTQVYANFIAAVNAEGCPVYTDTQINPGDMLPLSLSVSFQVLAIDSDAPDSNSASIVLKMTYGAVDFIFEGDAPSSVESQIMANQAFSLDVEILKVSHHGSKYSTSDQWLAATSPDIGVISVGTNTYGHPAPETLSRLSSHDVGIYRTDQNGTIIVTADGTTWSVN